VRIAIFKLTLLLTAGLVANPARALETSHISALPKASHLTEAIAIDLANGRAIGSRVHLEAFERPTTNYSTKSGHGIWHIFYVAKSHALDACFSVDVDDDTSNTDLEWCS